MKPKKHFVLFILFIAVSTIALSQSKTVKAVQKANDKTRQVKEDSDEVSRQAGEVANNINAVKSNVKTIVSVFEPILRFRLKKKNAGSSSNADQAYTSTDNSASSTGATTEPVSTTTEQSSSITTYDNQSYTDPYTVTQTDINNGVAISTESVAYNNDGSANLGSQNNTKYGCYLDMVKGQVMDDIDAVGQSKNIDLIFTATDHFNEQVPMYAFLTPAYAKDDGAAYHFFKGTKFKDKNIPPASWDEVNESEVAMTALTPVRFEKIQNNNQLMAVVKQVKGFSQKVESRTKLDGKVLAVKTEMGDRTTYGLICISNHYGTIGNNGYLKIKIKVTGFDSNGDGNPDASIYSNY